MLVIFYYFLYMSNYVTNFFDAIVPNWTTIDNYFYKVGQGKLIDNAENLSIVIYEETL